MHDMYSLYLSMVCMQGIIVRHRYSTFWWDIYAIHYGGVYTPYIMVVHLSVI